jgi:hypothetical protein
MKKRYVIALLLMSAAFTAVSQTKQINAEHFSDNKIRIDGLADDEVWNLTEAVTGFIKYSPTPVEKAKNKTEVKIAYNDNALYVLAIMHINEDIKIVEQLTERDDEGVGDHFVFALDPFGDNSLSYNFGVSSAGVQFDYKRTEGNQDNSWNEVWKSKVTIHKDRWIAEMEIPYSAIRFPKEFKSKRKINFFRYINDNRREMSWSPVDPTNSNFNLNNGILTGFEVEKTPVRLSLSPYVAAYIEKNPGNDKLNYYFKGGADLKYGINESFTLDMMLIPDFGQVRSDDYSLNLSPYEVYYDERRSFFTEGTELFDRAGIFYSRRIGGTPRNFWSVEDQLREDEIIKTNPSELQLLNATKLSGKTKSGTSVGFLNAVSLRSEAEIEDTIQNTERTYISQELTNYNVLAFEQSLKNNSYVSLVNTNLMIPNSDFIANVSGTEFKLAEKTNTYAIFGSGAFSYNKHNSEDTDKGFKSHVSFEKMKGNFKFNIGNTIENDSYNPNYMGYLQNNNEIESEAVVNYVFYNPVEKILTWHLQLRYAHNMFYKPRHILSSELNFHTCMLLKNHVHFWLNAGGELGNIYNFDETRTEGRYYQQLRTNYIMGGFSTNYAKKFALDGEGNYWRNIDKLQSGYYMSLSPRLQLTKSFLLIFSSSYSDNISYGFVGIEGEDIRFGLRDRIDINNVLDTKYIFNNKSSLSLRISHIYSAVDYEDTYILDDEGFPQAADYEVEPIDFNMLNSYLAYNLEFAPGSFLSLTWKYEILKSENELAENYFSALNETFKHAPNNLLSLRVIFYLNYFTLKNKLKAR